MDQGATSNDAQLSIEVDIAVNSDGLRKDRSAKEARTLRVPSHSLATVC